LFETPTLIGSVVEYPLLVVVRMITSFQPAEALLTTAEMRVVPAPQGARVSMVKLVTAMPVLGVK
jgi:hypothetical protein